MKHNFDDNDSNEWIVIFIIILIIILFFDSCADNDNNKESSSIPDMGYHSDYWYDREHAKEKAKERYNNRDYEIRNGKQVPINKS